jgi:hypothetical protein
MLGLVRIDEGPYQRPGRTERVSVGSDGTEGNDQSSFPSMSTDGRFVAFSSSASNLVAGDTNGKDDIFVHDRTIGVTERVSIVSDGTQGSSYWMLGVERLPRRSPAKEGSALSVERLSPQFISRIISAGNKSSASVTIS